MSNRPTEARDFIGFISPVRGGYDVCDAFGRRLAIAPTIDAARNLILSWYRSAYNAA